MNASNGVQSNNCILQIITQQELLKLTEILQKNDFKDTKCPVKIRDIHKIERKNSISISAFGYENKVKSSMSVSKKKSQNKHVNFLLIGGEVKTDYVLIKNLNTFLYEYTLHRARKHFCCYSLQCLRTAETTDMSF